MVDKSHVPVCCGLMLVQGWEGPTPLGPGQNMHAWNTGSQAEPGGGWVDLCSQPVPYRACF